MRSETLLGSLLPNAWIVRRIAKDYGVDFEIELVGQEIVSGDRYLDTAEISRDGRSAVARCPVRPLP